MTSAKTWIAFSFLLLMSVASVEGSKPADRSDGTDLSDPMAMMLELQESRYRSPDDRMCERAARTPAFDLWIEQFRKGDLKAAEKHWGELLTLLKGMGCSDCSDLNYIASKRSAMLDTKASGVPLPQHLLSATEHCLGPRDRFTASCCKYLARQYQGANDYANAVHYRKRQLSILEEILGRSSDKSLGKISDEVLESK